MERRQFVTLVLLVWWINGFFIWYFAIPIPITRAPTQFFFIDCQKFVAPDDPAVREVVKEVGANYRDLVDWVAQNIVYEYDFINNGASEYYQLPSETLNRRKGDCDEFATLLCSMLRCAGYDAYVAIGQGLAGGHAWVVLHINDTLIPIEPQCTWESQPAELLEEYHAKIYFNEVGLGKTAPLGLWLPVFVFFEFMGYITVTFIAGSLIYKTYKEIKFFYYKRLARKYLSRQ